jgi:superfamily I DNA/RNA helicase
MFRFDIPPLNRIEGQQRIAVQMPIEENQALLISGCPGSGKTTVLNYRAKKAESNSNGYVLLQWCVLLQAYLKNVCDILDISEEKVQRVQQWYYHTFDRTNLLDGERVNINGIQQNFRRNRNLYDEIFLDEAQDLWPEFIERLPMIAGQISICCDNAQDVFGNNQADDIRMDIKTRLINRRIDVKDFILTINYRNTPEIYDFAKDFVPDEPITNIDSFAIKSIDDKPKVYIRNTTQEGLSIVENIIKNNAGINIGILCGRIQHINSISTYLNSCEIEHTKYHSKLHWREKITAMANVKSVVLCTHQSAKGLEFDLVILPFIEKLNPGPKFRRQYYVACTRAKSKLRLISMDKDISFIRNQIDGENYNVV